MDVPMEDFDGKLFKNASSNFFFLMVRRRTYCHVGVKSNVSYTRLHKVIKDTRNNPLVFSTI